MESEPPLGIRHVPTINNMDPAVESEVVRRKKRPKSASYEALCSAVYQLTRMADFKVEALLGTGFFANVYKVIVCGGALFTLLLSGDTGLKMWAGVWLLWSTSILNMLYLIAVVLCMFCFRRQGVGGVSSSRQIFYPAC